jgi:hypothetical protein
MIGFVVVDISSLLCRSLDHEIHGGRVHSGGYCIWPLLMSWRICKHVSLAPSLVDPLKPGSSTYTPMPTSMPALNEVLKAFKEHHLAADTDADLIRCIETMR